jgi:hypothetical protein
MIPYLLAIAGGYLIGDATKDKQLFAKGGGVSGMPEWDVTITSENGETYDWVGYAKNEDDALYKAEQEAGFESVETGINQLTDSKGNKIEYAKGGLIGVEQWNDYGNEYKQKYLMSMGYSTKEAKNLTKKSWESLDKSVQNDFKNAIIFEEVNDMKEMMQSVFAYSILSKDNEYIKKYKTKLGKDLFDKTFEEEKNRLQEYEVVSGVWTDSEGGTYNELRKRK